MPKLTVDQLKELLGHVDAAARSYVQSTPTPWDNIALASVEGLLANPDLQAFIVDRLKTAGIVTA